MCPFHTCGRFARAVERRGRRPKAIYLLETFERRVLLSGYTLNVLDSFVGTNGAGPLAGMTFDSAGNLFGTTPAGGANGNGVVFEVPVNGRAITALASFVDAEPTGRIAVDSAGNVFGTTESGGTSGFGSVWEVLAGSHAVTTLASFNGVNGKFPEGGMVRDSDGNLFGTASAGGANDMGVVFKLPQGGSAIVPVASFDGTHGSTPLAGVTLDAAGNIYGVTASGGTDDEGTVFSILHGTSKIATLASFNGDNGSGPGDPLTLDSGGTLFGTTQFGGPSSSGEIFEVVKGSGEITVIGDFDDSTNMAGPSGGLSMDKDGNLYGTASNGANDQGALFELFHGEHRIRNLFDFNFTDADEAIGDAAPGGVLVDSGGNLFGASEYGGTKNGVVKNDGTIFKLIPPAIIPQRPTVVSVVPQDLAGNGLPAGGTTGGQRSMVSQFVVKFSEPVAVTTGAFTLGLVNSFGSGANNGSADTDVSAVIDSARNPSGDGVTWIVPVRQRAAARPIATDFPTAAHLCKTAFTGCSSTPSALPAPKTDC